MDRVRQRDDGGQFSLIAMVLALVVVGVLTALAVGAFTGSGAGGGNGSGSSPVGSALDIQAESTLSSAVGIAHEAGTYGLLAPSAMSSTGGTGIAYTASASTNPSTVSIASTGGITGGSAVMAVFAADGTCWYAWVNAAATYYGAQTDQKGCQATAMPTAPDAGLAPSSTAIGWRYGGYPAP